jgi:predicted ATPase
MPGASGRVVIAHAVGDYRTAELVCARLEERGLACWLARRDIAVGTNEPEARAAAVADAAAIVAIVTAGAVQDLAFHRELELAFGARRPIIPVLVGDVRPEGAIRYYVGESAWIATGGDIAASLDELALALRRFTCVEELPRPATRLVGRQNELRELVDLLRDPATRLVTLTGPGGTGKTRLALEAARAMSPIFDEGAVWVSLASVRDPSLVLPTIARALELDEASSSADSDSLADALAGRVLLVVLDNVEHLLPEVAVDVAALLARCSSVRFLATSRERLDIAGETAFPIRSLEERDAAALFVARARSVGVEIMQAEALGELCRRLDNLPLAIELAAARTVLFTPAQLLDRLSERLDLLRGGRDSDPRQHTLRATTDWSYELLDPEEQRVFRSLAVFAGGFTLEAAEHVTAATTDTVLSLVEKSLVRARDGSSQDRCRMLETIAEYAAEKLAGSTEDDAVRSRHAEYYCRLAIGSQDLLEGPAATDALDALTLESDNVRLALEAAAVREPLLAMEAGRSLRRVMRQLGMLRSVSNVLDTAIAAAHDAPPDVLVDALLTVGTAEYTLGEFDMAAPRLDRAIDLARHMEDRVLLARALNNRAVCAYNVDDWETARPLFLESLELLDAAGHELHAVSLANLTAMALNEGDFELAGRNVADLRALAGADDEAALHAEVMASIIELCRGHAATARDHALAGLEIARRARLTDTSDVRWVLARCELRLENVQGARELLEAARAYLVTSEEMPYVGELLLACAAYAVQTGVHAAGLRLLAVADRCDIDAAYDRIWRDEILAAASTMIESADVDRHLAQGGRLSRREALELSRVVLEPPTFGGS